MFGKVLGFVQNTLCFGIYVYIIATYSFNFFLVGPVLARVKSLVFITEPFSCTSQIYVLVGSTQIQIDLMIIVFVL